METNNIDKKGLLLMVKGLDEIRAKAPDYPLNKMYLSVCYNFLKLNEIDLADAVFDRINDLYLSGEILTDLMHAFDMGQKSIHIQNRMDFLDHPGIRSKAIVDLQNAQNEAEFMVIVCDFPELCEISEYIYNSPSFELMCNTLHGFTYTIDLDKGKPREQ